MQVHKSEFRSALTCARTVYHTEGLSAFYVSYPTTLTMTVPFTAVQFTVYEQLKKLLNPQGAYSPSTHIVAGGLSGAVAAAAEAKVQGEGGRWFAHAGLTAVRGIQMFFTQLDRDRFLMHDDEIAEVVAQWEACECVPAEQRV